MDITTNQIRKGEDKERMFNTRRTHAPNTLKYTIINVHSGLRNVNLINQIIHKIARVYIEGPVTSEAPSIISRQGMMILSNDLENRPRPLLPSRLKTKSGFVRYHSLLRLLSFTSYSLGVVSINPSLMSSTERSSQRIVQRPGRPRCKELAPSGHFETPCLGKCGRWQTCCAFHLCA